MSIQKRQLSKIRSLGMEVRILQIILGESLAILTSKTSGDDLKGKIYDLVELIGKVVLDTGACIPSVRPETMEMANEIKEKDNLIDWTDAIFVSHAIVDQDARFVFTTDTKIQHSTVIQEKINARQEGWSKLNLMDSVPGS